MEQVYSRLLKKLGHDREVGLIVECGLGVKKEGVIYREISEEMPLSES